MFVRLPTRRSPTLLAASCSLGLFACAAPGAPPAFVAETEAPPLVVAGQAQLAACTVELDDFDDGTLQGWAQTGAYGLSNGGGNAHISGDSAGCTFNGMVKTFSIGDSASIVVDYRATSDLDTSGVTNAHITVERADGSDIISEYMVAGGTYDSGWQTFTDSFSETDVNGSGTLTVYLGTYDCWTTHWNQQNWYDNVEIEHCLSDSAAPTTTFSSGPNAISSDDFATFIFAANESGCTYECNQDSVGWGNCTSPHTWSSINDGAHVFEVRATDSTGNLESPTADYTWDIDTIPPAAGTVNDGPSQDIDQQSSLSQIDANWSGFSDTGSGITQYAWAIGTSPGGTGIQNYTSVGTATQASATGLTLVAGTTYYVTLRAVDGALNDTEVASDGVIALPVAPTISLANVSVNEGDSVVLTPTVTGTSVTVSWDTDNDGNFDNATGASYTFSTGSLNGPSSVTIGAQAADPFGQQDDVSATITIQNVAPVITSLVAPNGNEGDTLSFSASVTEPGPESLNYQWVWGDGSPSSSGATPTHAYDDQGGYSLTLTVTDGDGGSDSASATITIANAAPVIDSLSAPSSGDEGTTLSFVGTATDPGNDTLNYSWIWGDSTPSASSASATHSYADNGNYTVTFGVTDGDGGSTYQTATVAIANVSPTITSMSVSNGDEGQQLSFSGAASDPGADTLTYSWGWGDSTAATTGAAATHAYTDEGSYTVTLTVTDDDAGSTTQQATVTISNTAPTAPAISGPSTATEGDVLSFSAASTDAGADTLSYSWDWGDSSSTSSGTTTTHSYDDEGSYTLTVSVDDGDGGTASAQYTVVVSNGAPTVAALAACSMDEGASGSFSATVDDPGPNDVLTTTWNFGDSTAPVTGTTVSHGYADNGSYSVTVTVEDDSSASATTSTTCSVANVVPTITSASGPTSADEGEVLTFTGAATDPSSADAATLSLIWDWGDSSAVGTGETATHAFADEGSYTVTFAAADDDGGAASTSMSVAVSNVAPNFTSFPVGVAEENVEYSYQPTVDEPGDDTLSWTLGASAPTSMVLDVVTGALSWTPSYTESLAATATITLVVSDGDGGEDVQSWTISIEFVDVDEDGMADTWETLQGLDPGDPTDAAGDADADGMSNLDEFEAGTDPASFDGPTAPTPSSPIDDAEAPTVSPSLIVINASDPQGDTLSYAYEVWADEAMTQAVDSDNGIAEGTGGETDWMPTTVLTENGSYWWRAQASDAYTEGPWSELASFWVNAVNDPPTVPVITSPLEGDLVGAAEPAVEWAASTDPEGSAVDYSVQISPDLSEETLAGGTVAAGEELRWTMTEGLTEDAWYRWQVRASDAESTVGAWSDAVRFFYSQENAPPGAVVWVDPVDESEVQSTTPTLILTEAVDPEGSPLEYRIELSSVLSFDSQDTLSWMVEGTDSGEVSYTLSPAEALPEDQWTYARARAEDPDGVASDFATIRFFVRGDNNAPPVPTLLRPADGEDLLDSRLDLVVGHGADPEGDAAYIDFVVARDEALSEVVAEELGALMGTGGSDPETETGWTVDQDLSGALYWSARATDEMGASSDWATPFLLNAPADNQDPFSDGSEALEDAIEGCACGSTIVLRDGAKPRWPALGGVLLVGWAFRRRKRRS